MRAMILAAGLGTRMGSLAPLSAKPALRVRGVSVVGILLRLLANAGVREVMVNTHHRSDTLRAALEQDTPPGIAVEISHEHEPLGTGGGLRRAAGFLRESDPCLLLGGDMLLDLDLPALVRQHRRRGDSVTLGLRRDSRAENFGTIACDEAGCVRRIGSRFSVEPAIEQAGPPAQEPGRQAPGANGAAKNGVAKNGVPDHGVPNEGVFVSVRVIASRAFDTLPEREVFEDLSDWLAPRLAAGARDIRGELLDCEWQPVGTPEEYLEANLAPIPLSYVDLDALARERGVEIAKDRVVERGARLGDGSDLQHVVVWQDERVPAGFHARHGIFAGGRFHACAAGIGDT